MLSILIYFVTLLGSYFLFRSYYIIQGEEEAKYNPHGMAVMFMLIPIWNIVFPIAMILIEILSTKTSSFDYKKFFNIK